MDLWLTRGGLNLFINVEDVSKQYVQNKNSFQALERVSLEVKKGEFICLLGPSGCGKTTLLNAIAGFESINAGRIYIDGKEVSQPSIKNVTIFQNYGLLPWRTVQKNVELGLESKNLSKKERSEIACKFIDLVGLSNFSKSAILASYQVECSRVSPLPGPLQLTLKYFSWMSPLEH